MEQQEFRGTAAGFIPLFRKLSHILGGIFVVAGIIILLTGIPGVVSQWQSSDWSTVQGRIVEGGFHAPRGQDDDTAVVEYVIDGKRHRHIVDFRPHSQELEVGDLGNLRRYSHGARINVFYDPAEAPELAGTEANIYARDHTALVTGFAPDAFDFLIASIITIIVGLLFAIVPPRILVRTENYFQDLQHDPDKQVERVSVATAHGSYEHVEIRDKKDENEAAEPYVKEDGRGVVLFDSTQRPLRLLGGAFGMVLWLIIFIALYFIEDNWGTFEYVFLIGWAAWALLVAGFVYEVRLNKREGTAEKKYGWFFITAGRRYQLRDFDRVIVESRLHTSHYDHTRERYHRADPKFSVDLAGDRRLNLRVFGNLTDARNMGQEVSDYLGLPLASDDKVSL
jgi:hypothetical protein